MRVVHLQVTVDVGPVAYERQGRTRTYPVNRPCVDLVADRLGLIRPARLLVTSSATYATYAPVRPTTWEQP
ncbi:hypothetical protein ACKI1I_01650 [Streptomyces turgidiscabies]|uniref:Uncharacterized protein n=1 Tax=Streptomyces turgidiscabies (strain Car8) TaxID=698760 RepID=L7ETD4_STRT8|nr:MULTISPECIES: hypothetical protein [Streptomyces]ELP61650.1 hypothetical protein STRTUCAR8_05278 [Streptomyces turgidiscabies Car8]MDX3492397.1 hypothetical protein [Streptomyces turgidiscabies]GAQ69308.1 hypothetical protein T45_01032 [Streptomyces turgidiscabies]